MGEGTSSKGKEDDVKRRVILERREGSSLTSCIDLHEKKKKEIEDYKKGEATG